MQYAAVSLSQEYISPPSAPGRVQAGGAQDQLIATGGQLRRVAAGVIIKMPSSS